MCLPFLCGGRDDHGPSPYRSPPTPQHHHAFSDHQDHPAYPVKQPAPGSAYLGAETKNGASHAVQANDGGWRMDNGPAHPAGSRTYNSGAAEKRGQLSPETDQGYVAAAAGAPPHGPVAAPRPRQDWTRQGPARLFTRRAGDDDGVPTAASNDQVSRGGNRDGAGDREYRSKSRGSVIR